VITPSGDFPLNELISLVGEDVIRAMLEVAGKTPPGSFVEVGVYKGGTAYFLSELAEWQRREIFLYDTFEGIPYQSEFDLHKVGDFNDTSFEEVSSVIPYATVIKGIFPKSSLEHRMGRVSFVHLDCDQYQSYKDAIPHLMNYMGEGSVFWFDDCCLEGAKKAVYELFSPDKLQLNCGKLFVRL
jgi:hypothetical protein